MSRSGPVQFEKEENDPFGLDAFLDTAKRASKRGNEEDRRKEDRSAKNIFVNRNRVISAPLQTGLLEIGK